MSQWTLSSLFQFDSLILSMQLMVITLSSISVLHKGKILEYVHYMQQHSKMILKMLIGYWLIFFSNLQGLEKKSFRDGVCIEYKNIKHKMSCVINQTKNGQLSIDIVRTKIQTKCLNLSKTLVLKDTVGKPSPHSVEAREMFDRRLNAQFGRFLTDTVTVVSK